MAILKKGLDYFPLSIDFFNDDKVQLVSARFGLKGECIILRLMCKIYDNGYFYRFGNDELILFTKQLGDNCVYSFVKNIVSEAVDRGIFDKNLYEKYSILTSHGIQRRYLEATYRRKIIEFHEEFLLIERPRQSNVVILDSNVYIISQNGDIIKQSKVKESKVKERECEQTPTHAPAPDLNYHSELVMTDYDRFLDWLADNAPYCSDPRNFSLHITEPQFYDLKIKYTGSQIAHVIELIENRKDLRKKYTNFYKTVLNWAKKEYGN